MATALRRPAKGCAHYSDRGSQYCAHGDQKVLRQHGCQVSMSGSGNCYENATGETFFKTIKAELLWRHLQSSLMPLSIGLKKPLGLRMNGRLNEQSERRQTVTGPIRETTTSTSLQNPTQTVYPTSEPHIRSLLAKQIAQVACQFRAYPY